MHHGQFKKSVVAITPASVATNATAGRDIDTRGGRWTQIDLILPTTSAALATLKVQVGDTTSTYADVVPLVGGTATSTSAGFVIPAFNSSDPTTIRFSINKLTYPHRYCRLQVTPAAATIMGAIAHVLNNEDEVLSTTQQNVSAHIIV